MAFNFADLPRPTAFPPTEEQQAIITHARTTSDNMLVQALAGAFKTSTLDLIAKALPGAPILCVAFNKRIAEEMTKRLPSHCVAKTLNSIGHTAWGHYLGKRLTLNKSKMGEILRGFNLPQAESEELREIFGEVVRLASRAKLYGYIPEGKYDTALHLIDRETLETVFEEDEYPHLAWELLDTLITESIQRAWEGEIDFDDQIFMPTLFSAQFPKFPLVLVDEAQDLSPLNHQMISRLVVKRIIAVGDEFQSIYGFRGAVADGMNVLRQRFQMKEFHLTISGRCPKAIIRQAWSRAPDMKWLDSAPEGNVLDLWTPHEQWGANLFPVGSAIICRNNAPLFSLGLKLLRAGKGITIRGFDMSKRLVKILNEFGDHSLPREILLDHIDSWKSAKLAEGKMPAGAVEDRYACLRVFAEATETLGGAIAHAEALFAAEGPIELLSGHKSKGLEWHDVFHLDPWRVPSAFAKTPEELTQEDNLKYVITTRAKSSLTLIDLEDYDPEDEGVPLTWYKDEQDENAKFFPS
jgi:DNA helicase-2/ATP-dependent DNA helicase PcrA